MGKLGTSERYLCSSCLQGKWGGGGGGVKFKVNFCDVMQNVHGSMLYIRVDYQQLKIINFYKKGRGGGGGGGSFEPIDPAHTHALEIKSGIGHIGGHFNLLV